MDGWINWDLLSHPLNWVIVTLILIFMAYGGFAVWNAAGGSLPTLKVVSPGA
ncbi:MAG: hypothetical protein P4M15_08650 [Alphaproteobacteria bacterium]|nr:hypothetical protein [Alphaproteobacteria bacterium]